MTNKVMENQREDEEDEDSKEEEEEEEELDVEVTEDQSLLEQPAKEDNQKGKLWKTAQTEQNVEELIFET
jgi:hypothetical protein